MTIPATFDKNDLSRASLEARVEFAMQHRRNRTRVPQMSMVEIIEYLATDQRYFKDSTLLPYVMMCCQANFLNDKHFINAVFRISPVGSNTVHTMAFREEFNERYRDYEAFKYAIDSLCTYKCIHVDGVDIHWDTVEIMLGGPTGILNEFVKEFKEKMADNPIEKRIASKFADKYIRDAAKNMEYHLLTLSLSNLKVMCKSAAFQTLLTRAFTKLGAYDADTTDSVADIAIVEKILKPNDENIIKAYRQSKLFR